MSQAGAEPIQTSTVDELRQLADHLEGLKQSARTKGYCAELVEHLQLLRIGHATTTIELTFSAAFRARKLSDRYIPTNLSELWHPPSHLVNALGRANLPHAPVLYCSDGELMAIREVGGSVGDRIAIIELGRALNAEPHIFVVGELVHRYRTRSSLIGGALDDVLAKLTTMGVDLQRALMIDGFYADAFRTIGNDLYPLTVAIAQDFLSPSEIDGIAYPSVAAPVGLNLALKPSAAMRVLTVRRVKIVQLEVSLRDTFKARVEQASRWLAPSGEISWQ